MTVAVNHVTQLRMRFRGRFGIYLIFCYGRDFRVQQKYLQYSDKYAIFLCVFKFTNETTT